MRRFDELPIQRDALLRKPFPTQLLADLKTLLGDRVSTTQALREHHGKDESSFVSALPDAVVSPLSIGEVAAIVKRSASSLKSRCGYVRSRKRFPPLYAPFRPLRRLRRQ